MNIKDVFYLDTNYLGTFFAQKDDGLITKIIGQKTDAHMESFGNEKTSIESKVEGSLGAATIANISGSIATRLENAPYFISDSKDFKNIVEKEIRENILTTFVDYVQENNAAVGLDNIKVGELLNFKEYFEYVSFNRLKNLLTEDFCQKFADGTKNLTSDRLKEIRDNIPVLAACMPFDAFLNYDNVLVLLNKENLRENTERIGYKFEHTLTVIGRVNKYIPTSTYNSSIEIINTLNEIQDYAISLAFDLGLVAKKEVYLVSPIAIYY